MLIPRPRVLFAIAITIASFATMAVVFWFENYKYSLPTPVPVEYKEVTVGSQVVSLSQNSKFANRSVFFHFYNPDCPCSRFNARYLKSLIQSFNQRTEIVVVVQSETDRIAAEQTFEGTLFHVDENFSLAKSFGVYATPQAVIVDSTGRLFYRGNYNESRFCTARATNFAEMALLALLNNQPPPTFDIRATRSYGCELQTSNPYQIKL